jgi:hypothetical protein
MPKLTMPKPERGDGEVEVSSSLPSGVVIEVTTYDTTEALHISEHNAWKVLWKLADHLNVPLSPEFLRELVRD